MTPEAVTLLMDYLCEENEGAGRLTGLDEAVLGIARQHAGIKPVLCYSERLILAVLARDQFKDAADPAESAKEWYDSRIKCRSIGVGTPVIISDEPETLPAFTPTPSPIDGEGSATD